MKESQWTGEERVNIRSNLKQIRLARGYTGRGLAGQLGFPDGTLFNHERSGMITLENLRKYAGFYKIRVRDFTLPAEEFKEKHCIIHTPYEGENRDDLYEAVKGLDQFTKNWCMNVVGTKKFKEPLFQCSECEFATSFGGCFVHNFANSVKKASGYPMEKFGSMGHRS